MKSPKLLAAILLIALLFAFLACQKNFKSEFAVQQKWKFKIKEPMRDMVIKDNRIFVETATDNFAKIYLIDKQTGNIIWKVQKKTDEQAFDTFISGNKIYLLTHVYTPSSKVNWYFYAFDTKTGKQLKKLKALANQNDLGSASIVKAGNNRVYISRKANLVAINPKSGKKIWVANIPGNYSFVTFQGNSIYLANTVSLYSISKKNGHIRWRKNIGIKKYFLSPQEISYSQSNVFFIAKKFTSKSEIAERLIIVLNANNGKEKWRLDANFPIQDKSSFYFYNNGKVVSMNAKTGNLRWESEQINNVKNLLFSDNKLLVEIPNQITILDKSDGTRLNDLAIEGNLSTATQQQVFSSNLNKDALIADKYFLYSIDSNQQESQIDLSQLYGDSNNKIGWIDEETSWTELFSVNEGIAYFLISYYSVDPYSRQSWGYGELFAIDI